MSWERMINQTAPSSPEPSSPEPSSQEPSSQEPTATNESNPAPKCCEERMLFTGNDVDPAMGRLYDKPDEVEKDFSGAFEFLRPTNPHSEQVFSCCNTYAHQNEPHYTCTSCASLANAYLSKTPNKLLHGGPPPMKGKRFFPLCYDCAKVAKWESPIRGCICDYREQNLCFKCKLNLLEIGAAKRDLEVHSRMGFIPAETTQSGALFMMPALRCLCGSGDIWIQDGLKCTLRCAACEVLVPMISGRAWDPLAEDFTFYPHVRGH